MNITKEHMKRYAGKKGYNDKECRDAFKRFIKEDETLNTFVYDYMKLKSGKQYKIIDDPLGEKSVDMGIFDIETNDYFS